MKSATQVSILDIWTSTSLTSSGFIINHMTLQMSLDKQVFPLVRSTTFFDTPFFITQKNLILQQAKILIEMRHFPRVFPRLVVS